jgi:hypothetical protein
VQVFITGENDTVRRDHSPGTPTLLEKWLEEVFFGVQAVYNRVNDHVRRTDAEMEPCMPTRRNGWFISEDLDRANILSIQITDKIIAPLSMLGWAT